MALVVAGWKHVIICFGSGFVQACSLFHRICCCSVCHHNFSSVRKIGKISCAVNRMSSALFYGVRRETFMDIWIISPFKWEVKAQGASSHVTKMWHPINFSWTRWRHTGSNTFTGLLTAEGSKPQALLRPTLLCNSRPKAIIHGACQTGPALSHNHTCIQACVIVFTYMNAHWS